MLTLVFGIPGVGKTTVLQEVGKRRSDFVIKKFGSIQFDIAIEENLISDRDDIRKLPIEVQKDLQVKTYERIKKLHQENASVVIDTHAAIRTPRGYWPGCSENLLKIVNPDTYVLVETDPEIILRHRILDNTRERDDDNLKVIEEHQMINRAFAATYATMTNGCIFIVENEEGKPEIAADKIVKLFD
jgi:adenylate kinase